MRKFYQKEWFGIPFESFTELNDSQIADENFYSLFYTEFYKKYKTYDDLPLDFRENKGQIAKHIAEEFKDKTSILSIGSGNGYIELQLAELASFHITAVEPSKLASTWIAGNKNIDFFVGFFPEALPTNKHYDAAYGSAIDYVFDEESYIAFLKSIIDAGIDCFVMHNACIIGQRGIAISLYHALRNCLDYTLHMAGIKHRGQFWGYQRTIKEQYRAFHSAGFNVIEHGVIGKSHWIKGRV